jgi:hypothetical protein
VATVFISYRGPDRPAAERLAQALSGRGHDVWIDIWKIDVGDSIIGQINNGLSASAFLVLCLADANTASTWMDREWMSALSLQLSGANIRVLPVRLSGAGSPPAILGDVKYADLAASWDDGMDAICRALG